MSKVIAAVDSTAAARPVLSAAAAVARLFGAELEAVHVVEGDTSTVRAACEAARLTLRTARGPTLERLLQFIEAADVVAAVVGARATMTGRRPAGHIALKLASAVSKPLVVVPPHCRCPIALHRLLVPLDRSRSTAQALRASLALATAAQLEVIVLHVHQARSLPPFSDQPQHEVEAWTKEFLRRQFEHPELVRAELRIGVPGDHTLQVATEVGADLIALGWRRSLAPGHAELVREVLERSSVPVLLLPVELSTRN